MATGWFNRFGTQRVNRPNMDGVNPALAEVTRNAFFGGVVTHLASATDPAASSESAAAITIALAASTNAAAAAQSATAITIALAAATGAATAGSGATATVGAIAAASNASTATESAAAITVALASGTSSAAADESADAVVIPAVVIPAVVTHFASATDSATSSEFADASGPARPSKGASTPNVYRRRSSGPVAPVLVPLWIVEASATDKAQSSEWAFAQKREPLKFTARSTEVAVSQHKAEATIIRHVAAVGASKATAVSSATCVALGSARAPAASGHKATANATLCAVIDAKCLSSSQAKAIRLIEAPDDFTEEELTMLAGVAMDRFFR